MGAEVLHPQGCLIRKARPLCQRREAPASAAGPFTILIRRKALKGEDSAAATAAGIPRWVRVRPASAMLTNVFAGSPRALPLPSFRRREVEAPVEVDPSATIFLRPLLRLE